MKNAIARYGIITLALIALHPAFAPVAHADPQTREEAIALLISGVWHFAGSDWSNDRVFQAKGTVLVRASNAEGVIKWKMDSKQVNIIFEDHIDVMYLPIDPKGTKGMDQHGNDIVATLTPDANGGASAKPASALDALKQPFSAVGGDQAQAAIISQLTSQKWHFEGANWSETRVFGTNGVMTIEDNQKVARWTISGNKLVMTFSDHKDILFLPLDPKGTKGSDAYGRLVIATPVDPNAATPTPAPNGTGSGTPSGGSFFGTKSEGGDSSTPPPVH